MDFSKIEKRIEKSKVISLDIFDTLLFRLCEKPDKVFNLVAQNNRINENDFRNDRINAEKKARKLRNREITIEDIYDYLPPKYNSIKSQLMESELEIEADVTFPNDEMVTFIKKYKNKKRIILVSDMYLNSERMCRILKASGIKDYDKLYISCDYSASKSEGTLFDIVVKEERIEYSDIVHIGDNWKSDYAIPKKRKISSFQYKRKQNNSEVIILNEFLKINNRGNNIYYDFGYRYLGPAVFGYVRWIQEQLILEKIDKVFFFAREGQFIKKAFDLVKEKKFNEKYLYVSRRSLTIPALVSVSSIEEFTELRPIYGRVKVKDQFSKLGLEEELFKDYGWYKQYCKKTFSEIPTEIKTTIINDLFVKTKEVAKQEMNSVVKYLKQEEVFGKFAVVDLGWNGSMQRALQVILDINDINHQMLGYFLAQRDEFYKNMDFIENYGFLFNYGKVSNDENVLLNSGTNFLEVLFSADHGTTLKYNMENEKVSPVLAEFEYPKEIRMIKEIQTAALDFITEFSAENSYDMEFKKYFYNMYNLFLNPTREIVDMFGDLSYSDLNEKNMKLAPKVPLLNIKKWYKNFIYCGWKVAYLKRNIPFKQMNAFNIYKYLRRRFN